MAFDTDWLRTQAKKMPIIESQYFSEVPSTATRIFLCHSHLDKPLVFGLISAFKRFHVDVYVDWLDNDVPEICSGETAKKIKMKINALTGFYFLATENSMKSHWCPWEIGIADSLHKEIAIIPTETDGTSHGNEYLQLYTRTDVGYIGNHAFIGTFSVGSQQGISISSQLDL